MKHNLWQSNGLVKLTKNVDFQITMVDMLFFLTKHHLEDSRLGSTQRDGMEPATSLYFFPKTILNNDTGQSRYK